jgi:intracellular sulfur oxidation DsrE/DsrF family protein
MEKLPLPRRSFVSRLGAGTLFGAALAQPGAAAQAPSAGRRGFQPSRHTHDEWLEQLAGKHRFILDTTTSDGFGTALLYANNYFVANQSGYGLGIADLAVVIVARHLATAFAYNDAMWAKYGAALARVIGFNDPQTKQPAKINIYNSAAHVAGPPTLGNTLDSLLKRGVHLAVCQMATRFFAGPLAEATGGTADGVYNELAANVVSNSHMVPAGIVAISRAQERGYTFGYVG